MHYTFTLLSESLAGLLVSHWLGGDRTSDTEFSARSEIKSNKYLVITQSDFNVHMVSYFFTHPFFYHLYQYSHFVHSLMFISCVFSSSIILYVDWGLFNDFFSPRFKIISDSFGFTYL